MEVGVSLFRFRWRIHSCLILSRLSGNGLVSYYINLVLEGVGISSTRTKAAINGGLQVFNFFIAITAAMLVDWVGRRTLFIASNAGMLISKIAPTIGRVPRLTGRFSAFSMWTLTTALFSELNNTAAAKGKASALFPVDAMLLTP